MTGLSKSRYTAFCQCRKRLWLKVFKPNEEVLDAGAQSRFENGHIVGKLAQNLFVPNVDIDETTPQVNGGQDHAAMIANTQTAMAQGEENICEAAFSYNGNYCAVDILHKTDGGWAIYEVKSSSNSEDAVQKEPDDLKKYVIDIAFQKWVLEQCGLTVTGTYLVTLNHDYERRGELDLQQLFVILDVKVLVAAEYGKVPSQVALAHQVLQQPEPDMPLGEQCPNPYKCGFMKYCMRCKGVPDDGTPTVFDLYSMHWKTKCKHFNAGKVTFDDVKGEHLTDNQRTQVTCTLNGTEYVDKVGIRKFLNTLTYPLYFLDFESMMPAIPLYDRSRPHQQICFQYSLHIIERKGGPLEHKEYLAPGDGSDPRRGLAEALCRDIPIDKSGGCVLVYNKSFECGRIKEMASLYPDLAARLMAIHDNIKDLLEPFRDGHYYVPAMGGSFSIKSVLPALFPNDPDLDYHALQGVQNGGDAMTIFPKMQSMSAADADATRKALLAYCCLDTLALVKVLERLEEVSN